MQYIPSFGMNGVYILWTCNTLKDVNLSNGHISSFDHYNKICTFVKNKNDIEIVNFRLICNQTGALRVL